MKYTYTVTYKDFLAAQRVHMNRTPRVKWTVLIFLRIFPVLGIVAAIALFRNFVHPSEAGLIALCGVIGVGGWGIIMAILRPYGFQPLYKQMKNGRAEDEPCELELAEGQLVSRIPGISEGRFMPAAIQDFAEDDVVALLYVAPKRFLPIPKRAVDEAGWRTLHTWLASGKAGATNAD